MVFDAAHQRYLLFGGRDGDWNVVDETWEFDLENDVWSRIETQGSPGPRYFHAMAYDPVGERALLFGGFDGGRSLDDTWSFDYEQATWTQLSPTQSPGSRLMHAMIFDPENNQLVVFGGRFQNGNDIRALGDTWEYSVDDNSWLERSGSTSPRSRDHGAMAFDPPTGRAILFGGESASGGLADTWVYASSTHAWSQLEPGLSPAARSHAKMTYSSALGGTVLVGDALGDEFAWVYRAALNMWQPIGTAGVVPRGGDHMQAASDGTNLVILGGFIGGASPVDEVWVLRPE